MYDVRCSEFGVLDPGSVVRRPASVSRRPICPIRPIVCLVLVALAGTFASAAHAHPLDDEAELQASVHVVDDRTLELALEFRYRNVVASYTEFRNGLDRN